MKERMIIATVIISILLGTIFILVNYDKNKNNSAAVTTDNKYVGVHAVSDVLMCIERKDKYIIIVKGYIDDMSYAGILKDEGYVLVLSNDNKDVYRKSNEGTK